MDESAPRSGPVRDGALGPEVIGNLAVLVLATMVMILNETSLSVALPAVMADFGILATAAQWLTTGFMLTMAVVIPTTGFLIERFSTRQIFGAAMALFLTGTVMAAIAPLFLVLLAGRIVQAAGTALMIPTLMTVAMTAVPARRRGTVMGVISVVISVAPALGPTVGGAILNVWSWPVIFWAMVPLAVAIAAFGAWKLTNVGDNRHVPVDAPSVGLSVFAFGGLVYGLSSIQQILDGGVWQAVVVAVGIVSLGVFVRRQLRLSRKGRALMDLRPLGVRNYLIAIIIMSVSFGLLLGTVTILPIYLQTSLAVTPLVTGLVVMPGGILQGVISPLVGRIFDSVGPRPLMVPGALLLAAGIWAMVTLNPSTPVWAVVAMHVTFALGMAIMMTPLMTTALSSLPQELYSHGSAIMNTLQQLAGAAGTALLVVFFTRGVQAGLGAGESEALATSQGARGAFFLAGILTLVVAGLAPFLRRVSGDGAQRDEETPAGLN